METHAPAIGMSGFGEQRRHFVALLREVAELEHAACCQYLAAAFSIRTEPAEGAISWAQVELARGWKGTLLSVARQEMEHLAIVSNLLTAVGEAPWFNRPRFPTPAARYYPLDLEMELTPFSLETLGRFLLIELPDLGDFHNEGDPDEQRLRSYLQTSSLPQDKNLLSRLDKIRSEAPHGLSALYDEVDDALDRLAALDPKRLFIGPPAAQVHNATIFPIFPPVNMRFHDVLVPTITDLPTAKAAIEQIRLEGEGGPVGKAVPPGGDHFGRFVAMYLTLSKATVADPSLRPGRDVVRNPVPLPAPGLATDPTSPDTTIVTDPVASEAMRAFDLAYDLCLNMLVHFFALTPEEHDEFQALREAVFYPIMTLVLRPLGDLLTQLPASADEPATRAGPSFQTPRDVSVSGHAATAWTVMAAGLADLHARIATLAREPTVPSGIAARLEFMAQNVWRIQHDFATKTGFET